MQFLNFLAAQMIVLLKSIFLAVNAGLHCLNNVVGVYLVFMYRRPTLYPLEIAVDFLKSP